MTARTTDPFLLEILRNAFDTIAEEITITIIRTAYSQIVRDSLDFSTALCDAKGRTLAQGVCTPMHLGAFHDALTNMIEEAGDDLHPDDIFIMNDPYAAVGQHLPDIYVVKPIYYQNVLRGWSATLAHHSDVGGIVAGSNALGATEIWQEGLRLPVLKLFDKGKRNDTLWKMIALNVRTPDMVLGDLQAQIAACATGARGLQQLYERYGVEVMETAIDDLNSYACRLAEAEISDLPDGTYRFTDHIDGIGEMPEPITLEVAVTIDGARAVVDWTGSSPQVAGGINSTLPFTKACAYAALRSLMRADVPNCHGFTEAIEVRAPAGTVVNPVSPGPCGARGITGYRMIDCLFGALANAAPDRVTADGSGGSTLPTIAGRKDGAIFVFCETAMGTWGASLQSDGQEGVPHIGANQSNVPIEMIERTYPIRIEHYGFVPDTGGPGRRRGGLAIRRDYRVLVDGATLNVRSDKRDHPPHGLMGGSPGQPSMNHLISGERTRALPVLLREPVAMNAGDVFSHVMASGGGYGMAWEREPERVLADAILDKISVNAARRDFGVVITEGPEGLSIDERATRIARGGEAA
ncbi:acetophenone carboxylase delta subunit (plasmid) [Pseudosulfitobacter pseudonitzschiae]|uniref:Acetophenone carboxylase delta subunit n=1 Tax=Pseudosulfitobacter pseudonitzschiae TaxID=1402135 RepID=A0A221K9E1_9RHOB|nr:hydantoinase B/oxoprolinase family protein [Pseudosulfitobacter pseudonitzschiae]ASM75624.1 acetophenone carboxylase delta subunit [Pseudosulfitobacter pseudonitzschiae]